MPHTKIKLYTDLSLLKINQPTVDLLVPFCGQSIKEKNPEHNLTIGRFDTYELEGNDFFELSTLEDCDACLLPVRYSQKVNDLAFEEEIKAFADLVGASGKKTFVFLGSDIDVFNVKIKNSIIFCNTLYQSKIKTNEFAFTFFFEDFITKYYKSTLQIKTKEMIPTIGFCGFAPPFKQKFGTLRLKELLRLGLNYLGLMRLFPSISAHSYRVRAILSLRNSNKVKKKFIVRSNFGFGGPEGALFPGGIRELNASFRQEYVENIVNTDYTLCVRGYGNNSMRFFEALCCGRIPVFLNTDCVLPFDFLIDWKKYCVWVEERDINRIPEKVLEFHNNLTEEEFKALQTTIRNIWTTYFTPQGFYKHLYLYLNR